MVGGPVASGVEPVMALRTFLNKDRFVDTPVPALKSIPQRTKATGVGPIMTDTSRGLPERPMSPHLQVWRWHITMACSILHRGCVIGLYAGTVLLALYALALAAGPESYDLYGAIMGSLLGRLVLLGLTFALFFNIAYAIRQTFWDAGIGFAPKTADLTGAAAIAFAVVATAVTWVIASATGAF